MEKRQDADTQRQHNADKPTLPSVITNPIVIGSNNNENIFLSWLTVNDNQSFVLEQLREDDMVANIKQASHRDNNNNESFISDKSKDPFIELKTIQSKKKRKQKKKNSKVDISENKSSDQRLSGD